MDSRLKEASSREQQLTGQLDELRRSKLDNIFSPIRFEFQPCWPIRLMFCVTAANKVEDLGGRMVMYCSKHEFSIRRQRRVTNSHRNVHTYSPSPTPTPCCSRPAPSPSTHWHGTTCSSPWSCATSARFDDDQAQNSAASPSARAKLGRYEAAGRARYRLLGPGR
jgi:hypothetical protein